MTKDEFIAEAKDEYGTSMVKRALQREVSWTRYGWRVQGDPSMGDAYPAYWPKPDGIGGLECKCHVGRGRNGDLCTHVLAIQLKRDWDRITKEQLAARYAARNINI